MGKLGHFLSLHIHKIIFNGQIGWEKVGPTSIKTKATIKHWLWILNEYNLIIIK